MPVREEFKSLISQRQRIGNERPNVMKVDNLRAMSLGNFARSFRLRIAIGTEELIQGADCGFQNKMAVRAGLNVVFDFAFDRRRQSAL